MEWYHCPLQREQIDAKDITGSAERAFAGSLTDGYLNIVKTNGALLASAVRQLIAGLEKGAVLFHCTAGKDRTGILASCIFTLCGISQEDIVADYEVTYTYNKKGMNRLLRMLDEETRGRMEPLMRSDAESMERLLAFLSGDTSLKISGGVWFDRRRDGNSETLFSGIINRYGGCRRFPNQGGYA